LDPVTVSVTIDKPRDEVFEYLSDVANHPEFCDHFMTHWRLTREESSGRGAGARFRVEAPLRRFDWGDMTFIEVNPPTRIVAVGRAGKFNRVKTYMEWTLSPSGDGTKVEWMAESEPALPSDRLLDPFGSRSWWKRRAGKALRRLRSILEEDYDRGARATVAGI
jgi:uncharacterized protein YndB with AHSA1/START domain